MELKESPYGVETPGGIVGLQEAPVRIVSPYVKTYGPAAVRFLETFTDMRLDPWQKNVLRDSLGVRDSGKWASPDVGLVVSRQNGKVIRHDALIPTPNGFVRNEDLRVGDEVMSRDGSATRVLWKSERHTRPYFKITFDSGRTIEAGDNHKWQVIDRQRQNYGRRRGSKDPYRGDYERTLTTLELLSEGLSTYNTNYRFAVPLTDPVQYPTRDLPMDPYVLGAWLGDGHHKGAAFTADVNDEFVIEEFRRRGYQAERSVSCPKHVSLAGQGFRDQLREAGVFGNKHIPEQYLTASVSQRMDLLRGLMDTDGYSGTGVKTTQSRRVEFCNTNRQLADSVYELAWSLGYKATLKEERATLYGKDCGPKYRVMWTAYSDWSPFAMPRKTAVLLPRPESTTRAMADGIVSIEPVGDREGYCIAVEHESRTYLAGRDYVVTHNSELAAARILIGLYVLREPLILFSAHRADTAGQIFKRAQSLIRESPELLARTKHKVVRGEVIVGRQTNGEWSIDTIDGKSSCQFRTRTKNAGRGFTADCLIMDEAMDLDADFVGDVYPTLSARPNAQALMMGSAGTKESEAFGADRTRALGPDPGLITWLEWSASLCDDRCDEECEEHDDPYDAATYAKTNPAYGIRISHEAVEKDRRKLNRDEFVVERLSVGDWPTADSEFAIVSADAWEQQLDMSGDRPVGKVVFAVSTSIDLGYTSITVAGFTDELRHDIKVQVTESDFVDYRPGTKWVVPRLVELCNRWKPYGVVLDEHNQAGMFKTELEEYDIEVASPRSIEYAQACASVVEGFEGARGQDPWLWHSGQPELTTAIANVDKRKLSGLWAWAKANEAVDIIALESATLAVWGLKTLSRETPNKDVFVLE